MERVVRGRSLQQAMAATAASLHAGAHHHKPTLTPSAAACTSRTSPTTCCEASQPHSHLDLHLHPTSAASPTRTAAHPHHHKPACHLPSMCAARAVWAERVRWMVGTARGLAHLHAAGVGHGDVAPHNVLVVDVPPWGRRGVRVRAGGVKGGGWCWPDRGGDSWERALPWLVCVGKGEGGEHVRLPLGAVSVGVGGRGRQQAAATSTCTS